MKNRNKAIVLVVSVLLNGCAVGPDYRQSAPEAAPAWVAPLPHGGSLVALTRWWESWNDPALTSLIEQGQRENPTVAQAVARIRQARATVSSQTSALLPSFDGRASDIRSKGGMQTNSFAQADTVQRNRSVLLDALWELDLVGGGRRAREASRSRLDARTADWHDARVSIAAEIAGQYVNLRTCELLLTGYEVDAQSRRETARLTELKTQAGFEAPAISALSAASASEAHARLEQQRGECHLLVKAVVELTAAAEPALREQLMAGTAKIPSPADFALPVIPAEALSQRPDLAAAERELAATMADIGVAIADRFPRLSLSGTIGFSQIAGGGAGNGAGDGRSWSYGPALTLPIFDFGRRAANVDVARARHEEAVAAYRGKVLRAVREVEESLVRLDSAARREADANAALTGYRKFLLAAEARVKTGAGSIPELEEARRSLVAAQGVAVGVARERLAAWISLYKAVGGGWIAIHESTQSVASMK